MTDYIEKEAALNASKIVYIEYISIDGNGYEDGYADEIPVVFKCDIEAIPAADVAPVVHGQWLDYDSWRWEGVEKPVPLEQINGKYVVNWGQVLCSKCKELLDGSDEYAVGGAFCPSCGANMKDGDGEC